VDPRRFSLVGHGDLPWWNPIEGADFDALVARASLPAGARILDVGCGNGNLLRRVLAAVPGSVGTGVDRAILPAPPEPRLWFREEPFDPAVFPPVYFDLVLCVGSSHAAGGAAAALRAFAPLLRPRGCVLLGEGFWEREPDEGYLALLEATREEFRDLAGTSALGPEAGYEAVEARATPREAWDRYEGTYAANIERFAAEHPSDPDVPAMLARIRPWREGYLRWGRTTLGFALVLFRLPGTAGTPAVSKSP
jgi:SAM-dependent methyltransferase